MPGRKAPSIRRWSRRLKAIWADAGDAARGAKTSPSGIGASYDLNRLKSDPAYNAALGAAELGGLIEDYRGSYILTFAGYNAGRGSVRNWIERYGDPRDPKVDPVDWVEQIPFSETRNYVQRIMENVQVYRARFGGGTQLLIEADLRRGTSVAEMDPVRSSHHMYRRPGRVGILSTGSKTL